MMHGQKNIKIFLSYMEKSWCNYWSHLENIAECIIYWACGRSKSWACGRMKKLGFLEKRKVGLVGGPKKVGL